MEVKQLTEVFLPAKWINVPFSKFSGEGWFLLEINPLPPKDEIELVVSDIDNNKPVFVGYETGKIYHSNGCDGEETHSLKADLIEAIKILKDETFKVAVLPKGPERLATQPVAIALEPEINYFNYPDHPHLNEDGTYGSSFYFPHSFCYKHNHVKFREGLDTCARVLDAFEQISIWLLRHQVWLAIRELNGKGRWIGKGTPPLPDESFPRFLDGENICRCGNKLKYKDCHMKSDFRKRVEILKNEPYGKYYNQQHLLENWVEFQKSWHEESLRKNQESFQIIKRALL